MSKKFYVILQYLLIILLVISNIFLFFLYFNGQREELGEISIIDYREPAAASDAGAQIIFGGYRTYTISANEPNICLHNSEKNFVDMQYCVYDVENDVLLAQTGKVHPDSDCYVELYSHYPQKGTYIIKVKTIPYEPESEEVFNGLEYEVELTVH